MRIDWKLIVLALVIILGFVGRKQLETIFSNGRDLLFSGMSFKSGEEIFEPEPMKINLPDLEDNIETTEIKEEALSEEKGAEAGWQLEDTAQAKTTVLVVKTMTLEEVEVKVKEIQKETEVLAKAVTKFVETQNRLVELQKQVNEISAKVGVISQEVAEFANNSQTS
jgi:hypothetical protein